MPALSFSASRDERSLVLTAVNSSHDEPVTVDCSLGSERATHGSGEMLHHSDFNAGNTFEAPDTIIPQPVSITLKPQGFSVVLPALCVATVTIGLA